MFPLLLHLDNESENQQYTLLESNTPNCQTESNFWEYGESSQCIAQGMLILLLRVSSESFCTASSTTVYHPSSAPHTPSLSPSLLSLLSRSDTNSTQVATTRRQRLSRAPRWKERCGAAKIHEHCLHHHELAGVFRVALVRSSTTRRCEIYTYGCEWRC